MKSILQRTVSLWLVFFVVRVSAETTSGFPSEEDVRTTPGIIPNPVNQSLVTQWLFPSIRFTCNGNVTSWIFRAKAVAEAGPAPGSSSVLPELPLMNVWRENVNTPLNPDDYVRIEAGSGSEEELVGVGPVYEYVLQSPVEVQENDVFGIFLPYGGDERLRLLFSDLGDGGAPISYRRFVVGAIFDTLVFDIDERYIPLVTAVIDTPDGTTSVPLSPSPTPITTSEARMPSPTIALPPIATLPPTTAPSNSPPVTAPSSSSSPSSSPPPDQQPNDNSGGDNIATIAAAVVSTLLGVLLVSAVIMCVLIVVLRRKQKKIYEPKRNDLDRMDNPMYQGVVSGAESKAQTTKSTSSNGSYHVYAMPSQPSPPPQETLSNGIVVEHYEFADDILPVSLESRYQLLEGSQTLASQYEIPVSRCSSDNEPFREETPQGHVYSVLEGGIFVPTEEERKSLTRNTTDSRASRASGASFDDSIYSRWSKKYRGKLQNGKFFEQEDIYWKPASSKTALYDQLSKKKYREILRNQIQVIEHLGAGQFGTVNKGLWQIPEDTIEVAVKTLQPNASEYDRVKFLQEAAIMGQFLHPNVVKLHGVVTVGEPTMIVLEYMPKGDLRNYLKSRRPQPGELVPSDMPELLLKFCREIASGMNYLSNKAFVHRDLAARNILVASNNTCKIGDFGMSRDLEDNNYYITHGGKIPVKWTAPEALHFRKYSTASDVWSYGAVMYEIWSLGHKPFREYTNQQAMQLIGSGFRLCPPPGCSRPLYGLMIRCWHSEAGMRPTFSAIVKMLSHSDSHLLSWTNKDRKTHPQAVCIGAPLTAGEDLYPDLQDYYMDDKTKSP